MPLAREPGDGDEFTNSLDQLIAVISHELRTPLTPSLLIAESLLERDDLPPDIAEGLEVIRSNIEVETRLINELLDCTRIARGGLRIESAPIDVHEVIRSGAELARRELWDREQDLQLELHATVTQAFGDARRLQHVFWNILRNVSKCSPESSVIQLRTADEPGIVVVTVSGARHATDHQPSTPGATSATEPSEPAAIPLELSVSRRILEAHQGTISAMAFGPGKASTFIVQLPARR